MMENNNADVMIISLIQRSEKVTKLDLCLEVHICRKCFLKAQLKPSLHPCQQDCAHAQTLVKIRERERERERDREILGMHCQMECLNLFLFNKV